MHVIITVCVLLSATALATAQNCSDAEIERCHAFSPFETNIADTVVMQWISTEDLEQHCMEYEQAKSCIDEFEHLCHPIDRLVFFGRDYAYDWLCEDALQEYIDNRDCFLNSEIHEEGQNCNDTLSNDLDSINHDISSDHSARKICLYANNYLDCIENAVMSECDEDAADWQREFDTRALEPLLSIARCTIREDGSIVYRQGSSGPESKDNGLSTTTYIIIGCVIAMSLIIIVVLILMILQIRKQRKQRQMRRESRGGGRAYFNNALDPSATVYPGGAMAGPLPEKGPLPPPAYDSQPPPSYTADYADLPSKTGAPRASGAPSVAGSARSSRSHPHPPEYASRAGSVNGDARGAGAASVYGGAAPSVASGRPGEYSYADARFDDARSVRTQSSRHSKY